MATSDVHKLIASVIGSQLQKYNDSTINSVIDNTKTLKQAVDDELKTESQKLYNVTPDKLPPPIYHYLFENILKKHTTPPTPTGTSGSGTGSGTGSGSGSGSGTPLGGGSLSRLMTLGEALEGVIELDTPLQNGGYEEVSDDLMEKKYLKYKEKYLQLKNKH